MFDLKKLQRMQKDLQEKMESLQGDLDNERVEGASGGGMVKVIASGNQQLIEVHIDPQAVDPGDIEMLQDLVIAAVNSALDKARELRDKQMQGIMPSGTGIPGMPF